MLRSIFICVLSIGAALPLFADENITPQTPTAANTLVITGPNSAIPINTTVYLEIEGLTLDEIKAARAAQQFDMTLFPLNGAKVHAAYDWLNDQLELSFIASEPGEYLVKLHLIRVSESNSAKLDIAAIVVVVEGGDTPDPFPLPITPTLITIIEETDDRSVGLEGAKLALHLNQVQSYLKNLPFPYQILDDDQPLALSLLQNLPQSLQNSRPVLMAYAGQKFLAADSFAGSPEETIAKIKKLLNSK